jgi:hypothetical protein
MNTQLALGLPAEAPSNSVVINARCMLRAEEDQRVILVGGLAVFHYGAADTIAEAYAMVMLVESGYACIIHRISASASSTSPLQHVDFEDGREHHHRCRHHRPIGDARNTEWALPSVRLRYPHTPHCLRPIRLPVEFVRQFAEPAFLAVLLNVRKVLAVHPRCATIGFTTPVGILQHILRYTLSYSK